MHGCLLEYDFILLKWFYAMMDMDRIFIHNYSYYTAIIRSLFSNYICGIENCNINNDAQPAQLVTVAKITNIMLSYMLLYWYCRTWMENIYPMKILKDECVKWTISVNLYSTYMVLQYSSWVQAISWIWSVILLDGWKLFTAPTHYTARRPDLPIPNLHPAPAWRNKS
jgi:hypothetical protein